MAGDGDGSAPIIQIHQLSDVTLQNILVRGSSGHAIQAIAATDASEEGEGSGDVPTLTLIDVSLLSNDGDGLNVEGLIDVSIQGGRFNNNDGDGIEDGEDICRSDPEDKDGFQDEVDKTIQEATEEAPKPEGDASN